MIMTIFPLSDVSSVEFMVINFVAIRPYGCLSSSGFRVVVGFEYDRLWLAVPALPQHRWPVSSC